MSLIVLSCNTSSNGNGGSSTSSTTDDLTNLSFEAVKDLQISPAIMKTSTKIPKDWQVTLTWDTKSFGKSVSFSVKRGTSSKEYVDTYSNITSPYVIQNLTAGSTQYFVVYATESTTSKTLASKEFSAKIPLDDYSEAPGAFKILSATPADGKVTITWGSAARASYYVIQSGTSSGSYPKIVNVGGPIAVSDGATQQQFTDTGLINGATRYYIVIAINSVGSTKASEEASATPGAAPGNFTLSAVPGNASVSLNWGSSTDASSYIVKRATSPSGPFSSIANGLTSLTYTDTNLSNNTTYYYIVTAVNGANASKDSNQVSVIPMPPPDAFQITGAQPTADRQIKLTWTSSNNASSYDVQISTDNSTFLTVNTSPISSLTYTVTALTDGQLYYFKVIASNPVGSNSASTTATPVAPSGGAVSWSSIQYGMAFKKSGDSVFPIASIPDGTGNYYTTGISVCSHSGTVSFFDGNQCVVVGNNLQVSFLSKHDANGALLWTKLIGNQASTVNSYWSTTFGSSIAIDSTNNTYVAGYTNVDLNGPVTSTSNVDGGPYGDALLVKFDQNGNLQWTRQFGTIFNNSVDNIAEISSVATDSTGNIIVAGMTNGTISLNSSNIGNSSLTLPNYQSSINSNIYEGFVAKFDTNGNPIWFKQFTSLDENSIAQDVIIKGVTVDTINNNIAVIGRSNGKVQEGTPGPGSYAFLGMFLITISLDGSSSNIIQNYKTCDNNDANFFNGFLDVSSINFYNDTGSGKFYVAGSACEYDNNYCEPSYFIEELNSSGDTNWCTYHPNRLDAYSWMGSPIQFVTASRAVRSGSDIFIAGATLADSHNGGAPTAYFLAKHNATDGSRTNLIQNGVNDLQATFGESLNWLNGNTTPVSASNLISLDLAVLNSNSQKVVVTGGTNKAFPNSSQKGDIDSISIAYDLNLNPISGPNSQFPSIIGTNAKGETSLSGLKVDNNGNTYVLGTTEGSNGSTGGQDGVPMIGIKEIYIKKFDSAGTRLWTTQIGPTTSESSVKTKAEILESVGDIALSDDGLSLYIGGYTDGIVRNCSGASPCIRPDGDQGDDMVIAKINTSDGSITWIKQFGLTTANGSPLSYGSLYLNSMKFLSGSSNNYIYISGTTDGDFGSTLNSYQDAFLAKLDASDGSLTWAYQFNPGGANVVRLATLNIYNDLTSGNAVPTLYLSSYDTDGDFTSPGNLVISKFSENSNTQNPLDLAWQVTETSSSTGQLVLTQSTVFDSNSQSFYTSLGLADGIFGSFPCSGNSSCSFSRVNPAIAKFDLSQQTAPVQWVQYAAVDPGVLALNFTVSLSPSNNYIFSAGSGMSSDTFALQGFVKRYDANTNTTGSFATSDFTTIGTSLDSNVQTSPLTIFGLSDIEAIVGGTTNDDISGNGLTGQTDAFLKHITFSP